MKNVLVRLAPAVAVLGLAAGWAEAGQVIDNSALSGGAIAPFGEPNTAYYGQSFTPAGDGLAHDATVYLNPIGPGDTLFHVLLADLALSGSEVLHPTSVLYESGTIDLAPGGGMQAVSFGLGDTPLVAGHTYGLILDSFVAWDGGLDTAYQGYNTNANNGSVGHFFFYNVSGGSRADHFAGTWSNFDHFSAAFTLGINDPQVAAAPEPSTLVGAGTAAVIGLGYAWRRRKRAAA
jgi:hypothetical protein